MIGVDASGAAPPGRGAKPVPPQMFQELLQGAAVFAQRLCAPPTAASPRKRRTRARAATDGAGEEGRVRGLPGKREPLPGRYRVHRRRCGEQFAVRPCGVDAVEPPEGCVGRLAAQPGVAQEPPRVVPCRSLSAPPRLSVAVGGGSSASACLVGASAGSPFDEEQLCKICCSEQADVVLLPCRHGDMCHACFRRILFMRPPHRGGSSCPICRKDIFHALRIEAEELRKPEGAPRYARRLWL